MKYNKRVKKLYIAACVIIGLMLIPLSIGFYKQFQVYYKGHLVNVTITRMPSPLNTKGTFMDFEMNGRSYYKKIYGDHSATMHVGSVIQLKYLEGYEHMFLFPDENPVPWGFAVLLGLLGLLVYMFYRGVRNEP